MRRKRARFRAIGPRLVWMAALWVVSAGLGCSQNRSGYGDGQVTLLFTNSHGGQADPFSDGTPGGPRGGLAPRATLIAQARASVGTGSVLLVDVGDLLGGATSTLDRVSRGGADVLAMNAMGYDAAAVGAGDFAFGSRTLADLARGPDLLDYAGASLFPRSGGAAMDFSAGSAFPFVATNVVDATTSAAPTGLVHGPILFRLGGVRIGLIAVTATTTPVEGRPPSTFSFSDPVQLAQSAVQALGSRVDIVVALSDQTDAADAALLAAVPGIDVLIGGGGGAFTGIFTRQDALSGALVPTGLPATAAAPDGVYVRTETGGRTLGRLDLRVEGGRVVAAEVSHLETRGVAPDPAVDAIVQPFRQERDLAESLTLQTVLGTTTGTLDGTATSVRATETAWGDLVADAVRDGAAIEVALVHAGVFHGEIPAGTITTGQVFDVLPTRERVATTTLTGAELLAVFEHAVASVPSEAFLQVAGVSFRWDAALPAGARVIASSVQVSGRGTLVPTATYTVATAASIAAGGDGFATFAGAPPPALRSETIASLVVAAVQAQSPLSPVVAGRITRDN